MLDLAQTKEALERFRGTPAELETRTTVPHAVMPERAVVTHVHDVRLGPHQSSVQTQQQMMERDDRERALERARGPRTSDDSLRVRGSDNPTLVEIWAEDFISAHWEDERTLVISSHAGRVRLSAREDLPKGPPYHHELWMNNVGGVFYDSPVPLIERDVFEHQNQRYYVTRVNRRDSPPLVFVVPR
jgi:hypothetical protein